jgi:surface protein
MFNGATTFNHDISGWTGTAATSVQTDMFTDATAFNAKYTCSTTNQANTCVCNADYCLTDSTFNDAISNCLSESPVDGLCTTYGLTTTKYGTMPDWDVHLVEDMHGAFQNREMFNADISGWRTSSVTDTSDIFHGSKAFNRPIGAWDISNVKNMRFMFEDAHVFNQPLGNWDVSQVRGMGQVFYRAHAFNQPIGNWNTSRAYMMEMMFYEANAFNQDISSWDVSGVNDLRYMFYNANSFAQDLSSWTGTGAETPGEYMFYGAAAFQAKFWCPSAIKGPATWCECKTDCVASSPPPPPPTTASSQKNCNHR